MVPGNLSDFGLGNMSLWYKEVKRDAMDGVENPAMLIEAIKSTAKAVKRDKNNEVEGPTL